MKRSKKRKVNVLRVLLAILLLLVVIFIIYKLVNNDRDKVDDKLLMINLMGISLENVYDKLDKYEIDSLIELQIPTKDGYTFSGWQLIYGDSILNGNNVTFKGKQSLVKALWNPIKYKISFELNGGISNINNFDVLYDEIIEVENPTREGYKFTGWDITGDVNKKVAKHGTDKSYVENSINDSVKSKYYKNLTNKLDGNIVFNATWVDDIEPIVETSLNTSTFTNSSVILNYTFKDAGSGIKEYSIDNTNNSVNWITLDESQKEITGTYSITENGIYYLNIKDTDGNISKKEIGCFY